MLDKQASNPVIINQLRRNDSNVDKVKVNDNYFNNYMKQASIMFKVTGKKEELKKSLEEDDEQMQFFEAHNPNNQLFKHQEAKELKQDSYSSESMMKPNLSSQDNKSKSFFQICQIF